MKKFYTLIGLLFALNINAQDGSLDSSFGVGGKIDFSIFKSFVDMKIDYSSYKILALGKNINGIPILVRLNWNFTYDTFFDGDGIKEIDFNTDEDTPSSFFIYENSNGTTSYLVASSLKGAIAKINDDGSFANFGTNGIYYYNNDTYYHSAKIGQDYANNKIVIASDHRNLNSYTYLHKILETGGNDPVFNAGNPVQFYMYIGYDIYPNAINTDDSGNIYVSGAMSYGGGFDTTVKKFSTTGVQDTTYSLTSGGGSSARSYSNPGYIFNANDNTSYTFGMNGYYRMLITKKTATGVADNTFGTSGTAVVDFTDTYYDNVNSITGHGDALNLKIILAGRTRAQSLSALANISLARIDANGVLDTSFGTAGKVSVPTLSTSYWDNLPSDIDYSTGKLYVMGYSATGIVSLYRFNLGSILSTNQNNIFDNNISIYPNPAQNILNIQTEEKINTINIIDMLGRNSVINNFNNNQVDVSNLSSGLYFITIQAENGSFKQKFIKQ